MYNHNVRARKKEAKKIDYVTLQKERAMKFLDAVEFKKEISYWDLQQTLGYGPGVYERLCRDIKLKYSDEIQWIKKTRTWKYIPLQPNIPVAEQVKEKLMEKQIG